MVKRCGIFFQNGIGNFVLFTAAIRAVNAWMDRPVTLFLSKFWEDSRKKTIIDLAKLCPWISNIEEFGNEPIKSYDFLWTSQHMERTVYKRNFALVDVKTNWKFGIHELEFYFLELSKLGYHGPVYTPEIPFPGKSAAVDKELVVLCGGTQKTELWTKKQWPIMNFSQVASILKSRPRRLVWVGDKSDRSTGDRLKSLGVENLAGKLSIIETCRILSSARYLISSDTGMAHLCAAVGGRPVTIFGPTLISKNRPYSEKSTVIRPSNYACSPCQNTANWKLCTQPRCIEDISGKQVFNILQSIKLEE